MLTPNVKFESQEVRREDGTIGRLTSLSQSSMPDFPFEALERFQKINPKVVNTFLSEFEKTAAAQRQITDREMNRESLLKFAGLGCGCVIILGMLGVCCYCLYLGYAKTAVLFGSAVCIPVALPLLQLVFNRSSNRPSSLPEKPSQQDASTQKDS